MEMTSRQLLDAVDKSLAEVEHRLASGELNQSGRYYSDEELAAGAATGGDRRPVKTKKASAA